MGGENVTIKTRLIGVVRTLLVLLHPYDGFLTVYCALYLGLQCVEQQTHPDKHPREAPIIQIDATPFRQWYEPDHVQSVSKKPVAKVAAAAAVGGRHCELMTLHLELRVEAP